KMPVTLPPGRLRLATRPSFTGSVPAAEDDWYRCGCRLGGDCREAVADDDRDLTANKIGRQFRQSIGLMLSPTELDGDVPALDVACFLETIAECSCKRCPRVSRRAVQVSDHRHRRLLRARRERPCRRSAAEQRDELAAVQLIELHSVPYQPGPDCRISNSRRSVSGYQGPHTCAQGPEMRKQHDLYDVADLSEVVA